MESILKKSHNIFILGIKGVGMANLAVILKRMGKNVTGSDTDEHFITDELLTSHSINFITNFDPSNLPANIDLFIYSAAHKGSNNELAKEAAKRSIPVVAQTAVLGEIMKLFEYSVAVCGCHGKTTTSSLLAYALENLDAHPGYFIGTSTFENRWAGQFDKTKYFVTEADEYGLNPPDDKTPKFYLLHPTHILCLNIDFDHPDIYKDISEIQHAFYTFFTAKPHTKLVLNTDNMPLRGISKKLPSDTFITFGESLDADYQIHNPVVGEEYSEFDLYSTKEISDLGHFKISLSGKHNISNAAGVIAILISLGFKTEDIKKAIQDFSGAKRRFEKVANENGILLYDDYGHHPLEISSTILSAKLKFKSRRIIVIFQPHTFSRTMALKNEFIEALSKADLAIIAPIFASARENVEENAITSADLVEIAHNQNFNSISSYHQKSELFSYLKENIQKGDVIFTIGAGDIYKLKNDIISIIKSIK
jgi:UDP-N-acetylmuramate--alanine ligase